MIQRFEVEPLAAFFIADKAKALNHVTGDQLRGKVAQFIGRREGEPGALRGVEGHMASTQDVDLVHGRFEGRRQVIAASLVGLEDAHAGHVFRPFRLDKIPDALLNGASIRASQAEQHGRRAAWCQQTAPLSWVSARDQTGVMVETFHDPFVQSARSVVTLPPCNAFPG